MYLCLCCSVVPKAKSQNSVRIPKSPPFTSNTALRVAGQITSRKALVFRQTGFDSCFYINFSSHSLHLLLANNPALLTSTKSVTREYFGGSLFRMFRSDFTVRWLCPVALFSSNAGSLSIVFTFFSEFSLDPTNEKPILEVDLCLLLPPCRLIVRHWPCVTYVTL